LSEIRITTTPRVQILEATIRKVSRGEAGIARDATRLSEGIVPISWTILEENDGAILQLIYAGPPATKISVQGTIVGQRHISEVQFRGRIISPSEQLAELNEQRFLLRAFAIVGIIIILFYFPTFLRLSMRLKRLGLGVLSTEDRRKGLALYLVLVVIMLGGIGVLTWQVLENQSVILPPIGLDK
jgi:hypothetical protein